MLHLPWHSPSAPIGECEQTGESMATTKKAVGLTSEKFIRHFKTCTGWKCEAGMRITTELTAFATAHLGSTRNIDELHGIFCLSKGIQPYRI